MGCLLLILGVSEAIASPSWIRVESTTYGGMVAYIDTSSIQHGEITKYRQKIVFRTPVDCVGPSDLKTFRCSIIDSWLELDCQLLRDPKIISTSLYDHTGKLIVSRMEDRDVFRGYREEVVQDVYTLLCGDRYTSKRRLELTFSLLTVPIVPAVVVFFVSVVRFWVDRKRMISKSARKTVSNITTPSVILVVFPLFLMPVVIFIRPIGQAIGFAVAVLTGNFYFQPIANVFSGCFDSAGPFSIPNGLAGYVVTGIIYFVLTLLFSVVSGLVLAKYFERIRKKEQRS